MLKPKFLMLLFMHAIGSTTNLLGGFYGSHSPVLSVFRHIYTIGSYIINYDGRNCISKGKNRLPSFCKVKNNTCIIFSPIKLIVIRNVILCVLVESLLLPRPLAIPPQAAPLQNVHVLGVCRMWEVDNESL